MVFGNHYDVFDVEKSVFQLYRFTMKSKVRWNVTSAFMITKEVFKPMRARVAFERLLAFVCVIHWDLPVTQVGIEGGETGFIT